MGDHQWRACRGEFDEVTNAKLMRSVNAARESSKNDPPLPGMLTRVNNYARHAVQHAIHGFPKATPDEKQRRKDICHSCDKLNREHYACSECGCPIDAMTDRADKRCGMKPEHGPPKWLEQELTTANPIVPYPEELDNRYDVNDIQADNGLTIPLHSEPMLVNSQGNAIQGVDLHGRTVVLMCGGPSLNDVDFSTLSGNPSIVTMGVNNVAQLVHTDIWVTYDEPFKFPAAIWLDPTVIKVTPRKWRDVPIEDGGILVQDCPNVGFYVRNYRFRSATFMKEPSFSVGMEDEQKDEYGQFNARSVMLAAIKLSYVMGTRKIVVIGADFHMDHNKPYAHVEPKAEAACRQNNTMFKALDMRLNGLRPHFAMAGLKVINATPSGNLTAFDRMTLADAIR